MYALTMDQVGAVSGGEALEDIFGGLGGAGGGIAAVGGGLAMDAGLAAGLVIGGGALAAVAGVGLAGYGVYELFK